jgi:hypothetical protein
VLESRTKVANGTVAKVVKMQIKCPLNLSGNYRGRSEITKGQKLVYTYRGRWEGYGRNLPFLAHQLLGAHLGVREDSPCRLDPFLHHVADPRAP